MKSWRCTQARLARAVIGHAPDAAQRVFEIAVGGALDSRGDVGIGRPAIGRIVFETAVLRRIMRRRHHDAVGKAGLAALVVGQDGVGDHRRRRIAVMRVDHHLDAVGREHFERARQRRLGQRVGVDPDEDRPVDAAALAVIAQRLADRQDMGLVEGVVAARSRDALTCRTPPAAPAPRDRACRQNRRSPAAAHLPASMARRSCRQAD